MSTSLTRTWTRRIASYQAGQPIEKTKIGAFRKLACNRPSDDVPFLGALWGDYGQSLFTWQITSEQTEQGLRWLKLPKIYKQLSESQRAILDDFSHFLFVDIQDLSTTYRHDSAPVYRVCSNAGPWFDYVPRPWQSGGLPFEIVGGGR